MWRGGGIIRNYDDDALRQSAAARAGVAGRAELEIAGHERRTGQLERALPPQIAGSPNRADIFAGSQDYANAIEDYTVVLSDKDIGEASRLAGRLGRATAFVRQGRTVEAATDIQAILRNASAGDAVSADARALLGQIEAQ